MFDTNDRKKNLEEEEEKTQTHDFRSNGPKSWKKDLWHKRRKKATVIDAYSNR